MTKIDELLAVLDMPEDRHWQTLQKIRFPTKRYRHIRENIYPKGWRCYKCGKSLGNNTPDSILAVETKWCSVADPHCQNDESLADLAFRLRDETDAISWSKAKKRVYVYIVRKLDENVYMPSLWFSSDAKPIHWIIAALIAKKLARKELVDE